MTPEAKVKAKIKKILLTHNIWYAMPHGAGYGNAGIPDFLCCHKGKFIAIEAKANGNTVTSLQHRQLQLIEFAGGSSWIVDEDSLDAFEKFIEGNV